MSSTSEASISSLLNAQGRVFTVPDVGILQQELGEPMKHVKDVEEYTKVIPGIYIRKYVVADGLNY